MERKCLCVKKEDLMCQSKNAWSEIGTVYKIIPSWDKIVAG